MHESMSEQPGEAYRQQALDALSDAYARDLLSFDEFERKAALVAAAQQRSQIDAAVRATDRTDDRTAQPQQADRGTNIVAVLGDRKVTGPWLRGRFANIVSVMASNVVDLRDCDLGEHTQLHVVTVMADTTIRIPQDVQIHNEISAIMADMKEDGGGSGSRVVRLTGFALMGDVKISRK